MLTPNHGRVLLHLPGLTFGADQRAQYDYGKRVGETTILLNNRVGEQPEHLLIEATVVAIGGPADFFPGDVVFVDIGDVYQAYAVDPLQPARFVLWVSDVRAVLRDGAVMFRAPNVRCEPVLLEPKTNSGLLLTSAPEPVPGLYRFVGNACAVTGRDLVSGSVFLTEQPRMVGERLVVGPSISDPTRVWFIDRDYISALVDEQDVEKVQLGKKKSA